MKEPKIYTYCMKNSLQNSCILIQIIFDQRLLKMNDYKHIHNYASLYHTYNLHTKK